jgi:hypothetical protein
MRTHLSSLLFVGLLACTAARTNAPEGAEATESHSPSALPFVEDNYAAALAQAKERGVPLFVDTWAPW